MLSDIPIAALSDHVRWWQIPMLGLLIALLIFWKMYRNRQM